MPSETRTSLPDVPPMPGDVPEHPPLLAPRPLKSWLVLISCAGIFLFILSRYSFPLFFGVAETASAILAVAIFLVGWNTRFLTKTPTLLILAAGLFSAALVDLLPLLVYRGLGSLPADESNLTVQFWTAARYLNAAAFLFSALSLNREWTFRDRSWLACFLGSAALLVLSIRPLGVFPDCYSESQGVTLFKIVSEYLVAGLMAVSALFFWRHRERFAPRLLKLLLLAILCNILSEFSFTLFQDTYGIASYLGHFLKFVTVVIVYAALVKGLLRDPYNTLFRELTTSHHNLVGELRRRKETEEEKRVVNQEFSLLYRFARSFHSTLQLDALSHLILSAATSPDGGGFNRAMLFTVNERTRTVQGMLGIDAAGASLVLPAEDPEMVWEEPRLDAATIDAQRNTDFNRRVVKQRLPLDAEDNALARAYLHCHVVMLPAVDEQSDALRSVVKELGLGTAACVPLLGRNQVMGVLVVDTLLTGEEITDERLRFLEMFARQAGDAMENAQLLHRLERAHNDLREVQERLIEGEKLSVLGEMAAQVAHELKNPLVSIGGFAHRLSRLDLGDARANEYATIIAREVRRLEKMLSNILAFSKKQLVCFEECEFAALVREAITLERENCQRQSIEIRLDLFPNLPRMIGDCQQLRQVLLNLMINARQAMPEGGLMTIRTYAGLLRGDQAIVLEVEDTGGGIPPDVMRNIFNPFFSTRSKGTGLGLSISHRIVMHHHGEIEVINSERGARFIVRLPVAPPLATTH